MAAKVDIKKSMTSHRTWVNDAIKRAEKFLGDNPDGLITTGDQEAAEELIEDVDGELFSMVKKWTKVFEPQLEVEDPDNLLDEWDNNVHDISNRAENTIDELRKALKIFETKGAVVSAVSTKIFGEVSQDDEESDEEEVDDAVRKDLEEEFDEEEEDDAVREDLEEEFDEEEESSDNDDEDAFGEPDSDPDSDEDDSDVEGAELEKEPTGSEDDTEEMSSSDDTPDTDDTEEMPSSDDTPDTDEIFQPTETLEVHLPDPIPPNTLVEHLPDPIPPDTLPDILMDTIPPEHLPDTIPPEILLDTIPPDILPDAQASSIVPAPPRGGKRGDGDRYAPAPPWEERRGDGGHYATVPYVDPGGQRDGGHYATIPYVDPGGQRPEVIGTLCGRNLKDPSRSRIRISDRRRYRSYRGRFRPSSEDRRRSYRSNRDRFKKSINYKTLVMGPVSPTKTQTGQRTFVPVFYPVRMKREDNPNKWET